MRDTSFPSLKSISVGTEVISKVEARFCSWSISTLTMETESFNSSANSSKMGESILHGPHHSAEKSTRTVPFAIIDRNDFSDTEVSFDIN